MALVEIVRAQCRDESVLDGTGALLQDSRRAQQLASPYEYLYRTMPRSTRPPPHLHTTTLCYCDDVLSVPCTSQQPTASRTRTPRHPWIARQQRVHATRWSGVEALGLKVCTESLLSWAGGPSGVRTEIGVRGLLLSMRSWATAKLLYPRLGCICMGAVADEIHSVAASN